jgi:hypothetical protein
LAIGGTVCFTRTPAGANGNVAARRCESCDEIAREQERIMKRIRSAVIVMSVTGAVHPSSLVAQRTIDSARTLPVAATEFERLGREVRAALVAAPEKFAEERFGKFVELQASRGDLEGARESARQGRSWYPFARVAIVQYKAGDLDGAITTTRTAATFTDRAQALGYLSSAMPFNEGLALARTIEWPKQLVEELRRAARDLFHTDTARSMALLREAIGVAQRDTSSWGGYFDVELAYDQAERGDLKGALRIIVDTLAPGERASRLGRIARELQRAPVPRARLVADSLFREALRAADQVPDSARRVERRARVFSLYSAYASGTSVDALLAESRSPSERALVSARATSFAWSLGPDGPDSTRLPRIRELEATGQFRAATNEIYMFISQRSLGRMHGERAGPEWSVVDSLARRAVVIARQVTGSFADSMHLRLVNALVRRWPATARDLAEAIADSTMRSGGMLIVARNMVESDPSQALAYALEIPSGVARDSLFAFAALRIFDAQPDSGIVLARRIGTPSLRGMTLIDLAGRAATRGNASLARTLALEGMPGIDPLVQPLEGIRLVGLVRGGLYEVMLQWARSQSGLEARARVFFALFEAVASR